MAQLRHPRAGVGCALLAAAFGALGSVSFKLVPQIYRLRLWNAWTAPRWHTVWVYAFLALLAVWCVQAALQLRHSVRGQVERRAQGRWQLGLAVAQLGLVVASGAYLWFVVRPLPVEFVVTDKGATIYGEFYRALRIEPGSRESVPPRRTAVWLERRAGTVTTQFRVERGRYFSSATGTHQLVVARTRVTTDGAILRHGRRRVELPTAKPVKDGEDTLLFPGLRHDRHERDATVPHAELKHDDQPTVLPLDPEWAGENAFLGLKESPVVLLRVHRDLSVPLAGFAVLALATAVLLRHQARSVSRSVQ